MSIETILPKHEAREVIGGVNGSWRVRCLGFDCNWTMTGMHGGYGAGENAYHKHVADLIRAELTSDEVVEAVAEVIVRIRWNANYPAVEEERNEARAALVAAAIALGGE